MLDQYVLYQYDTCPFCARVRRFLEAEGVNIPMKDTMRDPVAFRELLMGGGRATVPCLRIEDEAGVFRWLYESHDIMEYLAGQTRTQASPISR